MRFAPGARRVALVAGVLGLLPGLVVPWAALAGPVLALAVLAFFRDPERSPPPEGVVAPADGRVSVVREEDGRLRVGVFMNVHDVHVARSPLSGRLTDSEHVSGAHRPAFSKDSDRNERVHLSFPDHEVTMIAGAFARRITTYVQPGEAVERGQRLGHIAFGSRVDVLLPAGVGREDLRVERGDRVRAGETVLAPEP